MQTFLPAFPRQAFAEDAVVQDEIAAVSKRNSVSQDALQVDLSIN